MCGIVGCVGHQNAYNFAIEGLEELEYRGYDSAGIGYFPKPENSTSAENPRRVEVIKSIGSVSALINKVKNDENLAASTSSATTMIGHTRWATHGSVTELNTHPHVSQNGSIALVHNGVIENHMLLKDELEANGYKFKSGTDTEVIPNLIELYLAQGQEPEQAFQSAIARLTGEYAIVACMAEEPDAIYAARLGGPLALGVNGSEQRFVSSDPVVWADNYEKKAIFMKHHEMAKITTTGHKLWTHDGKRTTRQPEELGDDFEKSELRDGNPNFMIQEIREQPTTVRAATSGRIRPEQNMVRLGGLESPEIREKLKQTERIVIVACGTSYHAGMIGKKLIGEIARIPVEVELASEFQDSDEPLSPNTTVIAISQSGETSDTRAAVEKAQQLGLLTLGVVNYTGSTIARITDAGVHCRAGRERSVASTKAFTSQVTVLAEIALALGALNKDTSKLRKPLMKELIALPAKIEEILKDTSAIEAAAKKYANPKYKGFFFIGRGYEEASAKEAALKLAEISYIRAEGYASGELKHGKIAVIDKSQVTFAIATNGRSYDKTASNIQEIKARKGPVIAIATTGNKDIANFADDVLFVPESMEQTQPILNAVVTQLFAYNVALELGRNIDKPRNLAKSVTVK